MQNVQTHTHIHACIRFLFPFSLPLFYPPPNPPFNVLSVSQLPCLLRFPYFIYPLLHLASPPFSSPLRPGTKEPNFVLHPIIIRRRRGLHVHFRSKSRRHFWLVIL